MLLAAAALAGCGGEAGTSGGGGAANDAPSAVVAVSFDAPLEGEVDALEIDATANDAAVVTQVLDTDGKTPVELKLPTLEPGTRLRVQVVARRGDEELLRQILMTEAMAGRELLIPMRMNDECAPSLADRDVSCAVSTCSQGVCRVPFVDPRDLDDYRPDWAKPPKGSCGGVDDGEPVAMIGGEGKDFVPLEEGQVVRPYRGLQGGVHLFLSVRASGIDQQSAVTHYFDTILSTGRESSVLSLERPYDVEDSGCHSYNVAYVLPPIEVVGETMRLGVNVADATGNTGHGHVEVVIGDPIEPE